MLEKTLHPTPKHDNKLGAIFLVDHFVYCGCLVLAIHKGVVPILHVVLGVLLCPLALKMA